MDDFDIFEDPEDRPVTPLTSLPLQELQQPQIHPSTSSGRKKELSRDDRLRLQGGHFYGGVSIHTLAEKTGFSVKQVRRALTSPATPQKSRRPRPGFLPEHLRDQLNAFLNEDLRHHDIPWPDLRYLVPSLEGINDTQLNRAMQDLGYSRCRKKKALPTTARTHHLRVQMAHDLLHDRPNPNNWVTRPVLFIDKTFFRNSQTGIK
ncbi:hypothetical protein S40285_10735 [Stachybotrys chlorohalonatus IBT 40285]|uniref:Transposase Tc1-like domain-containing protein n=1 Tax=Stachybotrys chlorohalonatus (strain IBT 40285) TaxID=1283841 RepID=A0A084QYP0_STAC4|nr:hypothetical protein S40285_10735 [Stachybotrys chlorohalonata IBT 40285]